MRFAGGHVVREWEEMDAMMERDGLVERLRVSRMLEPSNELEPRVITLAGEPRSHSRACRGVSVNFITTHLAHEIEEGVRTDAIALGIELESLTVEIEIVSVSSAEVIEVGNRPWIRYAVRLHSPSDPSGIEELHGKLVATTVQRLANEYETPIVGNIVVGRPTVLRNQ